MKKIYIHIGTSKTGSSAIQNFLLTNKELLLKEGYYYPEHKLDKNNISGGNASKLMTFLKDGEISEAKKEYQQLINCNVENIILSCESLYGIPKELSLIAPEARIIVYIRNQIDRIQSSYNQSVKKHQMVLSIDDWIKKIINDKNECNFSHLKLQEWKKYYDSENIFVRVYDKKYFHSEKIEIDFLKTIGCPFIPSFEFQSKNINSSYTKECLNLKLLINQIIVNYDMRSDRLIDRALQSYSQKKRETGEYINYSIFSEENANNISARFEYENKIITDDFLMGQTINNNASLNSKSYNHETLDRKQIIELIRYITNTEPKVSSYIADNLLLALSSQDAIKRKSACKLSASLSCVRIYNHINKEV